MNKNAITSSILSEKAQSKLQATLSAEACFRRAMQDTVFSKLEKQKRELILKLASASGALAKQLKLNYAELEKKQDLVLGKLCLKRADFQPTVVCKSCSDTGFVGGRLCACVRKKVNEQLVVQSGLQSHNLKTFADADAAILDSNTNLKKTYKLADDYCKVFPNNKLKNMVFISNVGVGKSFLLECMANELLASNHFVVFTTAFDLNHAMLKAHNARTVYERNELLEPILECDLLIIDDLGSEPTKQNDIMAANLFTVLNERVRSGRHTITSSNLAPYELEDFYGNRVISRLFDRKTALVLQIKGDDLRLRK